MANHKSAAKRARQSVKRNEINRTRISKVRTAVKKVATSLEEGNAADAKKAMVKAESALSRAATLGTMHKKTASRKISRLSKQVKKASEA